MILGWLRIEDYLKRAGGVVTGTLLTDGKDRQYRQSYTVVSSGSAEVSVKRADGLGDCVGLPKVIPLDEALVAFFGLYSGDGAKGSEDPNDSTRIIPPVSFSQKERHIVWFALQQFSQLFPGDIKYTFSLGEDSAYFMAAEGEDRLDAFYRATTGSGTPAPKPLPEVRPTLSEADIHYLQENRPDVPGRNEDHLAFYYLHKPAMEEILTEQKVNELASVGIVQGANVRVVASLRRPFKKGARVAGGSSRSDEMTLGGLNGLGELLLKMMHEVEQSILCDQRVSSMGLVEWVDRPSCSGRILDTCEFFRLDPYGQINGSRPLELVVAGDRIQGRWRQSSTTTFYRHVRFDPLWCYVGGLYLAEGSTPKEALFSMFSSHAGPMALSFTSSEGTSIELVLRALQRVFPKESCLNAWKVKVGSQYFPELVMTGIKHGMPLLRGGISGDGKLRTMEVSLAIKEWALSLADAAIPSGPSILANDYADRYSHVEPTGSGIARIDFWASSTLCRWYFPLVMSAVFSGSVSDPIEGFR